MPLNKIIYEATLETDEMVTTTTSDPVSLDGAQTFSAQCIVDVDTPAAKTFDSGESEVTTFTFPTKAGSTGGDYGVVFDSAGLAWAFALNKSGSDPAPVGAVYAAIPAGRKTNVDISGATTAAQVAALVETAFDALTSNPFVTDDTAADGTMTFTCTIRGPTTNAQRHNANDSGNGSLSFVVTNEGVASEVDITENTVTIPSHGFTTGLKGQLTSTGTLPAGVTTGVDYYVIVVDDDTIQFADSLAHALAGTDLDLTNQGTDGAVNTFTATSIAGGSVKLQKSNDGDNWSDEGSATNITADAVVFLEKIDPCAKWMRIYYTLTAGRISASNVVMVKGPN